MNGQAFQQLAPAYQRARPNYPEQAVAQIAQHIQSIATSSRVVVDVGAGTGIFTRQLHLSLPTPFTVIGIEPGEAMRRLAQQHSSGLIVYSAGHAEQLPLASDSVCGMTVAQALQWFERPQFLAEAARCLQNRGKLFIVQNNRHWQGCEFLSEYEALLEQYSPGYSRYYRSFDVVKEVAQQKSFIAEEPQQFSWSRRMSADAFIEMSFSSTKMKSAAEQVGTQVMQRQVEQLLLKHFGDNDAKIAYVTELFIFTCQK